MSKDLTAEEIEALKHRHIRTFGTRRGHVSAAQERALAELLPRFGLPYAASRADFPAIFGRVAPLVLEIGCGMGETTAAIAAAHPEADFVGCEVYPAGIGALCLRIEALGLKNLRVVAHDAVDVVREMVPEGSLAGVHIFFPDPWRKARHHKRRIVSQPFVGMLAARLAPGGYLHCATDWENYAGQMLEVLSAEPLLENLHPEGFSPVRANPLAERPATKFQNRGERLGYGIWDLVFVRKA